MVLGRILFAHSLMLPDRRTFLLDWRCAVDSLAREDRQSLCAIDRNRAGVCASLEGGRRHERTQGAAGITVGTELGASAWFEVEGDVARSMFWSSAQSERQLCARRGGRGRTGGLCGLGSCDRNLAFHHDLQIDRMSLNCRAGSVVLGGRRRMARSLWISDLVRCHQ